MANQEVKRIKDSTIQKLMAIIDNHNQNYHDQEAANLREEIVKVQKEIEMLEDTIKVKEDSNQNLTSKFLEIRLHCKIHVQTTEHQINRLKPHVAQYVTELEQSRMFYRHGTEIWQHKEAKYIRDIEKLNAYINDLHSTLERNGIFAEQEIEQNDEYESEVDSNRTEQYESDAQLEYDDVEFNEPEDQFQRQQLSMDQDSMQNEQFQTFVDGGESSEKDDTDQAIEDNQHVEEKSASPDENTRGDCIDSTDSQKMNWCDMIDDELEQQSQSIEPVNIESSVVESTCSIKEQSRLASSYLNTETGHKVLKSERPIETEVPQKLNLDPFINGYDQVHREKAKSKSKKQHQKKPKSKPKFSSLISFGSY